MQPQVTCHAATKSSLNEEDLTGIVVFVFSSCPLRLDWSGFFLTIKGGDRLPYLGNGELHERLSKVLSLQLLVVLQVATGHG